MLKNTDRIKKNDCKSIGAIVLADNYGLLNSFSFLFLFEWFYLIFHL